MTETEEFINELKLPETQSNLASVYAFSLHKSGSTLLFNMLAELAPHIGTAYFSMQDQMFSKGIPPLTKLDGAENFFKPSGYLYGGFRFYPSNYRLVGIEEHKKILLVRNPLDALVSMYFSAKKSHKIPKQGGLKKLWAKKRAIVEEQSIDEFVLAAAKSHRNRIISYLNILAHKNCRLYRYEDIIYQKKQFLLNVTSFFGWKIEETVLEKISEQHDILPKVEDETKHIRQVHPGNYRKQLSEQTITELEVIFQDILVAFGYKADAHNSYCVLKESEG